MVERFNGRISELLQQTRFNSRADLETTLLNYLKLYNHHVPQRAIGAKTPIQALKEWQQKKPYLFVKRVYDQTGLDSANGSGPSCMSTEYVFQRCLLELASSCCNFGKTYVTRVRSGIGRNAQRYAHHLKSNARASYLASQQRHRATFRETSLSSTTCLDQCQQGSRPGNLAIG